MTDRVWKLSPSDFAFLWEECKRCFYLKVVRGFDRPRGIMPKIFTMIDREMKTYFGGKSTAEFAPGLPPGMVSHSDEWVESEAIPFRGPTSRCFLRGKLDTVIRFESGEYAVIDFKTSETKAEHVPLYGRQLHAYAYALEHPAREKLSLNPVTRLGLLVFEPDAFARGQKSKAALSGGLTWVEIKRNDREFLDFLGEVLSVLNLPEPPEASPSCEWCAYRERSRRNGL